MHILKDMFGEIKKSWQRYKWLHVAMWLLVCASTFVTYYEPVQPLLPQISNSLAVIIASFIPFYATAYWLIPEYLYKKKNFLFILLLVILLIFSGFFMMIFVRSIDHIFLPKRPVIPPDSASFRFAINIFTWTCLIASFGAGGLKIMSDSFRLRKKLFEIEKEKINTELNFLRNQVNPHFLFNVMNTIYFQIDKSNTEARASVETLSEMLRYQLYECTADKIELKKEIEYLENYVTMQSLRMEKGSDVQFYVKGHINGQVIAPLLLLPLIENAFKHVSHFKDTSENKIHIILEVDDKYIRAETSNSFDPALKNDLIVKSGGLGLKNLERRLQLIYPELHSLQTQVTDNLFYTTLKINYK